MAQTLDDLRQIAAEYPDAPKWWLGDWANHGAGLGVSIDEATERANVASFALPRAAAQRDSVVLPTGVLADSVSLRLPPTLSRGEWERVGGVILYVHDEKTPPRAI